MALYGFSKCSDGRLYHAFLATEALVAFDNRLRADKKRESDRERLAKWRETKKCKHDARLPDDTENRSETRFNTRNDTQDETLEVAEKSRLRPDQTRPDLTSSLRSDAAGAPRNASAEVFGEGLAVIRRLTGKPEKAARSFLGKLRQGAGDNDAGLLQILRYAETQGVADPEGWLMAAAARQGGARLGKAATQREADHDDNQREIERLEREARCEQWSDPFDGHTIEGRAA